MTGWTRVAPGVYDDGAGGMHIVVSELLVANGYPDTQENRDQVEAAARRLFGVGVVVIDPPGILPDRCGSSIHLTAADDRGVPTHACCSCGWRWIRPDDDPWAETLPVDAYEHRRPVLMCHRCGGSGEIAGPDGIGWCQGCWADLRRPTRPV